MKTGFKGTFVIPWSHTELDGEAAAPVSAIRVGACWSWTGEPTRVDGASAALPLGPSGEQTDLRKRAAPMVRRLLAGTERGNATPPPVTRDPLFTGAMVVTDGQSSWDVTLIPLGAGRAPLLMFLDQIPPRRTDLWIVRHTVDSKTRLEQQTTPSGVICFTPGTMILTPTGPRDVASLREGDHVQTQDNGASEILWLGARRVSGARLQATPDLAPVRLKAGALDRDVPDAGLLVSPDHRLVLRGARARALFDQDEVLVAARDLINDRTVLREYRHRDLRYIHMMLPQHEIVFANGVATESFHPASAALSSLHEDDRLRMLDRLPCLAQGAQRYGPAARRCLTQSDAAVLRRS